MVIFIISKSISFKNATKLKKDGIEAEPIRQDWHGLNFTFVKDPDGLPIEIKERGNI